MRRSTPVSDIGQWDERNLSEEGQVQLRIDEASLQALSLPPRQQDCSSGFTVELSCTIENIYRLASTAFFPPPSWIALPEGSGHGRQSEPKQATHDRSSENCESIP